MIGRGEGSRDGCRAKYISRNYVRMRMKLRCGRHKSQSQHTGSTYEDNNNSKRNNRRSSRKYDLIVGSAAAAASCHAAFVTFAKLLSARNFVSGVKSELQLQLGGGCCGAATSAAADRQLSSFAVHTKCK